MQLLLYTVQVVTEWSDGFKGMDKKFSVTPGEIRRWTS